MVKKLLWAGLAIVVTFGLVHVISASTTIAEKPITDITGSWTGSIPAGHNALAVEFRFARTADGRLVGVVNSPDQGEYGLVMSEVQASGDGVEFTVPAVVGHYAGNIRRGGDELFGVWSQGSKEVPLTMRRTVEADASGSGAGGQLTERAIGDWAGVVVAGGQELHVIFHIHRLVGPILGGTLDSVDQKAFGVPIAKFEVTRDSVTAYIPKYKSRFVGEIGKDGTSIAGVWTQAGVDFPLVLHHDR